MSNKLIDLLSFNSMPGLISLLIMVGLAGCAGSGAFQEGNALLAEGRAEEGFRKLEDAVKQAPGNAEYRIAALTQRTLLINKWMASAEKAREEERWGDAEAALRQVFKLDPDNTVAIQGLSKITIDRKHSEIILEVDAILKQGDLSAFSDASDKIRSVLMENPSHKNAMSLQRKLDDAIYSQQQSKLLNPSLRKPVSLEFNDAPLRAVVDFLSKVSGINFVFDNDVLQDLRVTASLKATTVEDALHLILATRQLRQKKVGDNGILIYPATPQKIRDYQPLIVRTFFIANADVKDIANSIKTIAKINDIVIDERLGALIVRDTPEAIKLAERIVSLQDLGDPEVMLEVEIMEVKRSRLSELGVQWPNQLSLTPLGTAANPLTLQALKNLNSGAIQASVGAVAINARKENQDTNVLANPRIRVKNKEKAKVMIGDRVPVITSTSTSTGFVAESVSYLDVGLKLEVEPSVSVDGDVAIKVNLEVSSIVKEILSKSGSLTYQIGTRGANTVLRLKNGETQILAGLISDEDRATANKVPGAGELPIVGRLFGSKKEDSQRSEILLSITPRIVRSLLRPSPRAAAFESGTESNIGERSLSTNSTPMDQKPPTPNPPYSP